MVIVENGICEFMKNAILELENRMGFRVRIVTIREPAVFYVKRLGLMDLMLTVG